MAASLRLPRRLFPDRGPLASPASNNRIIQGLMPTIAVIATETLSLFGIPAEVQGNLIRINERGRWG